MRNSGRGGHRRRDVEKRKHCKTSLASRTAHCSEAFVDSSGGYGDGVVGVVSIVR
jgi:hypothetical protein